MLNLYLRSHFLNNNNKQTQQQQQQQQQQHKYGNSVSRERRALEISGLDYPLRQRPIPDKRNPQNKRTNTYTLNA
jgi:hypothetical protein